MNDIADRLVRIAREIVAFSPAVDEAQDVGEDKLGDLVSYFTKSQNMHQNDADGGKQFNEYFRYVKQVQEWFVTKLVPTLDKSGNNEKIWKAAIESVRGVGEQLQTITNGLEKLGDSDLSKLTKEAVTAVFQLVRDLKRGL